MGFSRRSLCVRCASSTTLLKLLLLSYLHLRAAPFWSQARFSEGPGPLLDMPHPPVQNVAEAGVSGAETAVRLDITRRHGTGAVEDFGAC